MTRYPMGSTEIGATGPSGRTDMVDPAWGRCQIRLVADRVANRRSGSTHKVYRGWRFVITIEQGSADPGTTLLTVPIDPEHLAASQSRYALVQMANQGLIDVGEAAAFSWTTTSTGTTDPFAVGLEAARRQLEAAGWTRDATVPMGYAKSDPTLHVGDSTAIPAADVSGHASTASGRAVVPGLPELAHRRMTPSAGPAGAGLDRWETDGGT